MVRFFSQMMKLPVAAFASGMEMLARAMREIQKSFDQSVDAMSDGLAETLGGAANDGGGDVDAAPADTSGNAFKDGAGVTLQTMSEEESGMGDQDLSGDDLKIVRYRIIFTKRDYEATLEKSEEEVVDYPTNGASFGGLKVAEFLAKVERDEVDKPPEWKGKPYPKRHAPNRGWRIPREDRRYIMFLYEVIRRVEREEAEYAKDKVRVLRDIRDIIKERGVRVRSEGSRPPRRRE
jgi:hypothetical protein